MDDRRSDRIEEKLDVISEKISQIEVVLSAQHVTLVEHTRRSDLLEAKLAPVENHVTLVNAAFRIFGLIGMGAGTILSVLKLLKIL